MTIIICGVPYPNVRAALNDMIQMAACLEQTAPQWSDAMRREFRERLRQQYRALLVDAAAEGIEPLEFHWGLQLLQSMADAEVSDGN